MPFDHQLGAQPQGAHGDELADEIGAFVRHGRERCGFESGGHIARQLGIPAALHLRLHRHALQRIDARDGLDQEGLVLRAAVELLVQPRAQERRDQQGDHEIQRQRRQHHQRQPDAVIQHHANEHHREEHVEHHGDRIAGKKGTDVLQFPHTRHRIADPTRLEIAQWKMQQVAEQPGAKLDVDAAGGVREDVAA